MDRGIIFRMLDRIEDKIGVMAHEIPEIAEQLRKWQDGKLPTSYFKEQLNKYWDDKISGAQ